MKLVSRLNLIAKASDAAAAAALQDTADFILSLVRLYAPVDTGRLRDSYEKETVTFLHILIGTLVNYAIYQEYGTSRQRGTPHLTPAFAEAEDYFRKQLLVQMKKLG